MTGRDAAAVDAEPKETRAMLSELPIRQAEELSASPVERYVNIRRSGTVTVPDAAWPFTNSGPRMNGGTIREICTSGEGYVRSAAKKTIVKIF